MWVRGGAIAVGGVAAVLLALCGCSAATVPPVAASPTAVPSERPSATPSDNAVPSPSSIPENEASGEACAGLRSISNGAPADGVERILGSGLPADGDDYVSGYALPELRDTGPIEYATGQAVVNADGTPASYVVADGDTLYAISERFCLHFPAYLEWINSVRRNGAWSWAGDEDGTFAIYPGDTLNLDAHTITSVGDERGVVYDHEPDFYIPPQL
jgi:LysM repeat protein